MATIGELGGMSAMMGGSQNPFASLFGGLAGQQQQLQWRRYTPLSEAMKPSAINPIKVKRYLSFYDELREEIDNWLKS